MYAVNKRKASLQATSLVSPLVDFSAIGGLSLITYLVFLALPRKTYLDDVRSLGLALSWICNWPHFGATLHRLYRSKQAILDYPLTSIAMPLLLTAGVFASMQSPDVFATSFVKIFLLWSPFHFSGQALGISLLYARRAGLEIPPWARRAMTLFVYCSYLYLISKVESRSDGMGYYGFKVFSLKTPSWLPWPFLLGTILGGGAYTVFIWKAFAQLKTWAPSLVALPILSQFVWFVVGSSIPEFNLLVPFFHAMQYLLISWFMMVFENTSSGSRVPNFGKSGAWAGKIIASGAVLFFVLPKAFEQFTGRDMAFSIAVVISAIQIHHFFVDGVIWKLENKKVSAPLLMSLKGNA